MGSIVFSAYIYYQGGLVILYLTQVLYLYNITTIPHEWMSPVEGGIGFVRICLWQ